MADPSIRNYHMTIDMALLTPRQRAVIALHYFQDWTLAEIAEGMNAPLGTICSRLNAGL